MEATTSAIAQSKIMEHWAEMNQSSSIPPLALCRDRQQLASYSNVVLEQENLPTSDKTHASTYQDSYTRFHKKTGRRGIRFNSSSEEAVRSELFYKHFQG